MYKIYSGNFSAQINTQTMLQFDANLCYLHLSLFHFAYLQDHHDDIRQEQKWEMQALSTQKNGSSSNSSSTSTDDAHEHNLGCDSLTCETSSIIEHATTMSPSSSSSCGNHSVENCNFSQQQQLNFSGNTTSVAISSNNNNNNCDTVKNNNNQTHVGTPIEIVSETEATMPTVAAASVLIEQQNTLLRGVNICESKSFFSNKI